MDVPAVDGGIAARSQRPGRRQGVDPPASVLLALLATVVTAFGLTVRWPWLTTAGVLLAASAVTVALVSTRRAARADSKGSRA